jgi:transposase
MTPQPEDPEVIRVSQWAEIRHMFYADHVPRKQIARRLGLDIKTVRRALARENAPDRRESPPRGRRLDPWREEIEGWLRRDKKTTAKRVGRLLEPLCGLVPERTVREYVALVRRDLFLPEAFVHRTHRPGDTLEGDFMESWAELDGAPKKVKLFVATLPASNAYFAKVYRVERLECLLDGLQSAFAYFGGLPRRVVLDNTSLAVKRVLKGRDREQTDAFDGFRGSYPFQVDFCAPAKGNEKGSVETGVRYVRNLCFRPMPKVKDLAQLNAALLEELEVDLDRRRLPGGSTARAALAAEKEQLRPLPAHVPETCRTTARVVDKHGHVRVDKNVYSVPIEHAYRDAWAKLFHDRVAIAVKDRVVATHPRSFGAGQYVLDPRHILRLLEQKHRAVSEATALQAWALPETFHELRKRLHDKTRKPDREWVQVLRLVEEFPFDEVARAVEAALRANTPRLESIRLLLRPPREREVSAGVPLLRGDLAAVRVAPPELDSYDALWRAV